MANLIINQPLSRIDLEQTLGKHFCLLGFTGLVRMAASGIDMAAWDALAKTQGLSLVESVRGAA